MGLKTESDVVATAVIQFKKDKTIAVKFSTCDGVNARMLDAVPLVMFKELNALRTKKRLADTVAQHKAKQVAEEAERREKEKVNAS